MAQTTAVTLARGDGIGPEIMEAVLKILEGAKAPLHFDEITVGESVYAQGVDSGIPPEAWEIIRRNRVMLKAPITTPSGGGYKSLNVTIRKALGLFANVRQCTAYAPFVASNHPGMDLLIIRENEEDLYAGIEYQQTQEVTQSVKLISRPGSEHIIRYAFEYARAYGRKQVTCMTKDNIMKISDGLFHTIFNRLAEDYPEIQSDHQIIDIGAARVAAQPERLDVVVTTNLYGDILSDIAAQVAGSVGLGGSANVGVKHAMFEAIHGSAPDIAGKDIANPSGLLLAAIKMLVHIGEAQVAETIKNAWLRTIEDGIHTPDIYRLRLSKRSVGTQGFAEAVIERLGETPRELTPASYRGDGIVIGLTPLQPKTKTLVGVDVCLDWSEADRDPNVLGERVSALATAALPLKMIANRGVKVYPGGMPETFRADYWRCRFVSPDDSPRTMGDIMELLAAIDRGGLEIIKTEHLYTFDGNRGYSLGQGE